MGRLARVLLSPNISQNCMHYVNGSTRDNNRVEYPEGHAVNAMPFQGRTC